MNMDEMMEGQGNPDEGADENLIAEYLEAVLKPICERIDYQGEKLDLLEKVVMEELIGGIKGLYNKNIRTQKIGGLKEKFAPALGEDYEKGFSAAFPDADLWGDVLDKIEELKGSDGFDEDAFGNDIIGKIKGHIDKLRESLPPGASMKGEIEVAPEGGDGDEMKALEEMVRKQARRTK
jgi:hypothetical protein